MHADVVVVGGGGAGLAAAIAAAAAGADVALLEKSPRLGGSTALSVGSFSAAGTSLQRRRGIADTAESFAADMAAANGELEEHENLELRDILAREAGATFEQLRLMGLQFAGPTPEPPFTRARMHNIVPHSGAYIAALSAHARRLGARLVTGARVERLVVGAGGRVVGVDGHARIGAQRAVVLATGDYSASTDLKRAWLSPAAARLPAVNPDATGDGFSMALELGAVARNTWRALEELRFLRPDGAQSLRPLPTAPPLAWAMKTAIERLPAPGLRWLSRTARMTWTAPSPRLFDHGAIAVDSKGDRFADERDGLAHALGRQPANCCFIVFDATVARRFQGRPNPIGTFPGIGYASVGDYERLRPDVVHAASTIDALARQIGVDPRRLESSTRSGADNAGKDTPLSQALPRPKLATAPYYALGPLGAFVTLTDGGLDVNARCQVIGVDGRPIPGLFAAGSTGQGGLILKNHGLHLAWAMTSGRIAGSAAARYEPL